MYQHVKERRGEKAFQRQVSKTARRFLSISLTKLQMIRILCNCKIASVHDCAI